MAPHSSTLVWKIPWAEEPGRLQSIGLLRVRHDWATSLSLFTFMHWRRKWQPTPVFLPGESQGQGSLVGCRLWGHTESDMTSDLAAAARRSGKEPLSYRHGHNEDWVMTFTQQVKAFQEPPASTGLGNSSRTQNASIFFLSCFHLSREDTGKDKCEFQDESCPEKNDNIY